MDAFALVVGNARSGSTLLGGILDSHPNVLCANESNASQIFWRGLSREAIVAEIEANSRDNAARGRPSEGYQYAIPSEPKGDIAVYADKTWNPALLLLAGDRGLTGRLSETMQAPVRLIHSVRNPFDVIATMHKRSGASIEDRTRWFFMHCEAAQNLIDRGEPIHCVRHERLSADPRAESAAMFAFIGLTPSGLHLDTIAQAVSPKPSRTRESIEWTAIHRRAIERRAAAFSFLDGYRFDAD